MPGRRIALAALAALVGTLGFTAPAAAAPAAGQCWDYEAKALARLAIPGDPVPCEGPHRAETFAVGSLPAAFPEPSTATVRQRLDAKATHCSVPAMNAYLTLASPMPTRFRPVAVFPSPAQFAAGERWIRCDLVFDTGLGIGVMPKAAPTWVAENAANPNAFSSCTPGVGYSRMPSPTRTLAQECTEPAKQWILVARPALGKVWQRFPGTRALDSRSAKACARYKNVYNGGVKDPFARGWSYIYPMVKGWNAGVRTASCWVPLKQYLATPR